MTPPLPIRLRRPNEDVRIEVVPLIDVIFLVLTFFIYAMVLMIPARVLPMRLQPLTSGTRGEASPAVTVSITRDGRIAVDRVPTALDDLLATVQAAVGDREDTIVYIAAEETAASGDPVAGAGDVTIDRLPMFIDLYARLARSGLNIRLVGRPTDVSPGD